MASKRALRQRWKEEPGLTIRKKITEYYLANLDNKVPMPSDGIFRLLATLPYREEVINGRDLRGVSPGGLGGWHTDFSNTDFSYTADLDNFFHCDLSGAKFDEASAENSSFKNKLVGASFKKAKLRSCFISDADARNCCFDGAYLRNTRFDNTDLSGSSFRNADCNGTVFNKANLTGCDFRGAILEEAVLHGAIIDKTTDFRGASLINAYHGGHQNNAGTLLAAAVDLHQATYDETTKFGTDPAMFPIETLEAVRLVARRDFGSTGANFGSAVDKILTRLKADGYWEQYQDDLMQLLGPEERAIFDEVMDEAFRSLR